MDDSVGAGFMAVIAVSGSIVFLSLQFHKRLLSDFMNKIEYELGSVKDETKKKVKFSPEVENNNSHKKNKSATANNSGGAERRVKVDDNKNGQIEEEEEEDGSTMPLNWQVLYKGILEHRKLSTPCI